jgi:hypothetical protein
MAEVAALFSALEQLTIQVKALTENQQTRGSKPWHFVEQYKNIKVFAGDTKDYEEFATKLRSQVAAVSPKVARMMACVEKDCSEEMLAKGRFDEAKPEFDEDDAPFVIQGSAELYSLLLNMTTGEANAMVRRCQGQGWLAWKKLTASLNPRTLASGIKRISAVLSPGKVTQAAKADVEIEQWEDAMTRLNIEYDQEISAKMKVAVLYSMLPKELQEKVLDECSVNWDGTSESMAAEKFTKIKNSVKNLAKSRREMMGPKPMEVDRVKACWGDYAEDEWDTCWDKVELPKDEHDHDSTEEEHAYVRFVGAKGGKKGGKGFQGNCYVCGEFGHSQWDCRKGKGKGFGKDNIGKGYGKDGNFKGYGKGYGKESGYKGGYSSKGNGKGYDTGKGAMQRACFGCGALDHVIKDCPKNPRIQQVEETGPEVLFIGNVKEEEWKKVPMKVQLKDFVRAPARTQGKSQNRFKVLEVDEEDEEDVVHVRTVECEPCGALPKRDDIEYGTGVKGGKAGAFGPVEVYRGKCPGARTSVPLASTHAYTDPQPGTRRTVDKEGRPKVKDTHTSEWYQEECKDKRWDGCHETIKYPQDMGEVKYVMAVEKGTNWASLGMGDIVVDSAADESCWPVGQGDAYPTMPSKRSMILKTANGGDMQHYGQKEVIFKHANGKDPIGLTFQVTDVKKPLLAVRRLVEKGNKVVLSGVDGESYILNEATRVKVPVKKKGGSFVVEAHFVKEIASGFAGQA